VFDEILRTHYILIYSTHNGDDAPQNWITCRLGQTQQSITKKKLHYFTFVNRIIGGYYKL